MCGTVQQFHILDLRDQVLEALGVQPLQEQGVCFVSDA